MKLCFDLAEAFPSCSIAEMRRDAQETGGEAGNDRLPRGGAEAVHQAGNAAGGQRGAPGFQTRVQQGTTWRVQRLGRGPGEHEADEWEVDPRMVTFADDLEVLVIMKAGDTEEDYRRVVEEVERVFEEVLQPWNLRLNKDKTEILARPRGPGGT